jgi:hypothetical protein
LEERREGKRKRKRKTKKRSLTYNVETDRIEEALASAGRELDFDIDGAARDEERQGSADAAAWPVHSGAGTGTGGDMLRLLHSASDI